MTPNEVSRRRILNIFSLRLGASGECSSHDPVYENVMPDLNVTFTTSYSVYVKTPLGVISPTVTRLRDFKIGLARIPLISVHGDLDCCGTRSSSIHYFKNGQTLEAKRLQNEIYVHLHFTFTIKDCFVIRLLFTYDMRITV